LSSNIIVVWDVVACGFVDRLSCILEM